MDLAQIQILIVLSHSNKEFGFGPSNPNPWPKDQLLEKSKPEQFTLFLALLMEYVWSLRNKVVHGVAKSTMEKLGRDLHTKFFEHCALLAKLGNRSLPPV